jgi:hypothetical protein
MKNKRNRAALDLKMSFNQPVTNRHKTVSNVIIVRKINDVSTGFFLRQNASRSSAYKLALGKSSREDFLLSHIYLTEWLNQQMVRSRLYTMIRKTHHFAKTLSYKS